MTPTVHYFTSTVEAYDASQTDDLIRDGDVLFVPSEGAAAILLQAWPTALDEATAGKSFHVTEAGFDWANVECPGHEPAFRDYSASVEKVRRVLSGDEQPPT